MKRIITLMFILTVCVFSAPTDSTYSIDKISPQNGQLIKNDGTLINQGDILEALGNGITISEPTESFTGALKIIDNDHVYIHRGIAYSVSLKSTSIAPAGTYAFRFKTGDTLYTHFRSIIASSTANLLEVVFYESTTFSAVGTSQTPLNRNRTSDNVSSNTVNYGSAVTNNGLLIERYTVGSGGTNQTKSGGSVAGAIDEYILKRNTEYLILMTNIGTTTSTIGTLNLFWYEEDDG